MSGVVILGKDSVSNALKPVDLSTIATNTGGLATSAHQSTAQGSLSTIVSNTASSATESTLTALNVKVVNGSDLKANSLSVTLASDQGAISVSAPAMSTTSSQIMTAQSVADVTTGNSSVVDMTTAKCVALFGTSTDTNAEIRVMGGLTSGGTFYDINSISLMADYSSGEWGIFLDNVGCSYLRLDYVNTTGSSQTLNAWAEVKN